MRLLLATGLLFLAAGCSQTGVQSQAPTLAPSAASSPAVSATVGETTPIVVKDFTLDPVDVVVTGGTVTLAVTNDGPTVHNVAVRNKAGDVLGTTRDLRTGESETISPRIPAGSYILFCSLPGHESLGIRGTLEVAP